MASVFSGQWMVSIFLKDLKVWGQSQGGYIFPLKQFSPVCLLSPHSWKFCRSIQLVFKDSDVYMVENLFNWNFYIKIFFKKKMCLPKQKRLYPRDLFFPNEFVLLKCWFPCIFFQRCEFHNHLKGSLHFCSVLLFSHIPLPFGHGSIWVGWMRRGRVAVRVARGHLNSCVNGWFWE